jgi:hypothetical protein
MYAHLLSVAGGISVTRTETVPMTLPVGLGPEPSSRYRTTLLAARARQCRFIMADDGGQAVCCGAPTPETSSWCAYHQQVVFEVRLRDRGDRRRAA